MGLQSFERALGNMVDSVFSRSSRTSTIRPVELGRRLLREMDVQPEGKKDEGTRILTPIDERTAQWEAMSQEAGARADEDLQLRATRKSQGK